MRLSALVMLLVGVAANAVIVDDFVEPVSPGYSYTIPTNGAGPVVVNHTGTMLGGDRDFTFQRTSTAGMVTANINVTGVNDGKASIGGISEGTWNALMQWDGTANTDMTLGYGLDDGIGDPGYDLTEDGANMGVTINAQCDLGTSVILKLYSSETDWVSQTFDLGGIGSLELFTLMFSGGWTASSGAYDPTKTTAVELYLDGSTPNTDIELDFVETTNVPEPGTIALLGAGLLAVVRRRRRR